MSKHTPGPWRADGLHVKVVGGIVAHCPPPNVAGTFACMDNARLIAAAPEMLEALRVAFEELADTFHVLTSRQQETMGPVHAMVMGQISAAIARAEGLDTSS